FFLGIGGAALGGLESSLPAGVGGPLISKTIGTGGRMMGVVVPAAFGFEALKLVDKGSKKLRRRR
ncbi:unnamed protein product, partial [marine sediment metagenome]